MDLPYPTVAELEAVRKIVDDNKWGVKEVRENFPTYEIEEFPAWAGDKKYSFIVFDAIDPISSGWQGIFEEAEKDPDPNFMIFTANYYKVKRIPNVLIPFI